MSYLHGLFACMVRINSHDTVDVSNHKSELCIIKLYSLN